MIPGLPILLSLISSAAYGAGDFAGGLASRRAHVFQVVAIAGPAGFLTGLVALPLLGAVWSGPAIAWGTASGVGSAMAFALLYRTLAIGPMSVLSPLSAVVSAVIPVAVGVAEGERLTLALAGGLAFAMLAIVLLGGGPEDEAKASPRALLLAVAAGAAISVQLICLHQAPSDARLAPLVAGSAVSGALLVIAGATSGRLHRPLPAAGMAASSGVLSAIGNLTFLLAVQRGQLSVVAIITALYPAATVILARAVLGERIHRGQGFGLVAAAAGVCLLAVR